MQQLSQDKNKQIRDRYLIDYSQAKASTRISRVFQGEKIAEKLKIVAKQIELDQKTNIHQIMSEAKLLQSLNHPNIIKMYDYCCENNTFSMYLELCKFTLRHYQGHTLSRRTILSYAKQIAEGMDYLHSKGILHLDLKPENILLSFDYTVKIIDFGESLHNKNTKIGKNVKVTPAYSPFYIFDITEEEIVEFDEKFDVWSFGAVVYQLYSKKSLFSATNRVTLRKQFKKFEQQWSSIISLERIKDPDIYNLLRLTLQINKNQRSTFKQIKQYLSNLNKREAQQISSQTFIKIKPTIIIHDQQTLEEKQMSKKLKNEESKKNIALIIKYKDYLNNKILETSHFFLTVNSKNPEQNCLPYVIEKCHLTIIKVCLMAIQNRLYQKLFQITQVNQITLYVPQKTLIVISNITTLYKSQHLNKIFRQITKLFTEWKNQYRQYLQNFKKLLITKEPFKVYENFINIFKSDQDIFQIFKFDNPERYMAIILRKYVADIDKIQVNMPDTDGQNQEKFNDIARKNLYDCSVICALNKLLPQNSFSNNQIYHVFNDLKNIKKEQRDKQTMRNILYSMDISL